MFKSAIIASCVAASAYAVETMLEAMSSSSGSGKRKHRPAPRVIVKKAPTPEPIIKAPIYKPGPVYHDHHHGHGYVKAGY